MAIKHKKADMNANSGVPSKVVFSHMTSATPINKARRTVIVVPLSTKAKVYEPITVRVNCLNKKVTAICDQIRTIDKSRLQNSVGKLSVKDMQTIENSLKQILVL